MDNQIQNKSEAQEKIKQLQLETILKISGSLIERDSENPAILIPNDYDIASSLVFKNLKNAELVFDYSLENIKILQTYGIKAHFLPLGYTKSMEYYDLNNKNTDFIFIGSINKYRHNKFIIICREYQK